MAEKQLHNDIKKGRPKLSVDNIKQQQFITLCDWLDEEPASRIFTLDELHLKMKSLVMSEACENIDSCIYSEKMLKQKLIEHYEESITFTEKNRYT